MPETALAPITIPEILAALGRTRLEDLHGKLGIRQPADPEVDLAASLQRSPRFPPHPGDLLDLLSAPELRDLCRRRGLPGVGVNPWELVEELLVDPQHRHHEETMTTRDAHDRLPDEVRSEIAARHREKTLGDEAWVRARRNRDLRDGIVVAVAVLLVTQVLHYGFWGELVLALSSGGAAWLVGHRELGRIPAGTLSFLQGGIWCVVFGMPGMNIVALIFLFSFLVMLGTVGTLLGMQAEGCFGAD